MVSGAFATLMTIGLRLRREGSLTGKPVSGLLMFIKLKSAAAPLEDGSTSTGVGMFSIAVFCLGKGV